MMRHGPQASKCQSSTCTSEAYKHPITSKCCVLLQAAIIPQMQECARHAFAAVQDKLNPQKHNMTFELYGLDFMIDLSGKVCVKLHHS